MGTKGIGRPTAEHLNFWYINTETNYIPVKSAINAGRENNDYKGCSL